MIKEWKKAEVVKVNPDSPERCERLSKIESIEFIVEGSVAVNRYGERLGKREGYETLN
ncbi:5-formyltetrahydrofolate cyclo-ligase [Geoglobus acetivorans]|uniref:Uncharacterized protein n=1 Tax=Geoglobus acetivorans TaxID=565033 RepID=A0A0A7GEC0_GEOAI|nr:hypothetical protein GACE_1333 [Geoglobus acetivorans]